MRLQHARRVSRREFLGGLTLAGAAGCLGVYPRPVAAEPPPETRTISLIHGPGGILCEAPLDVAEEFLRGEGFTDVQYIKTGEGESSERLLASARGQISMGLPLGTSSA